MVAYEGFDCSPVYEFAMTRWVKLAKAHFQDLSVLSEVKIFINPGDTMTWDQALFSFRFENYIPLERVYENP